MMVARMEWVMGGESRLFFSRTEGLDVMRLALVMIPAWATGARLGGMRATIRSDLLNRRILNHGAALLSFFPLALKAGQ